MTNLVDVILNEWLRAGVISKRVGPRGGTAWGDSNKLALHTASGIGIDFFQANRKNWFTLLVCRTGSAASNERICNAAIARGERWDPYAGFRDRLTGDLLFVPGSERAVFEHVRLEYQEPWDRV
jgi:DNA polymerase/3'-5' exonuclease PolX